MLTSPPTWGSPPEPQSPGEVPTGQCRDNALAEFFFSTLKNELGDARPWPSRAAARTAIFEWIESGYNLLRLHSSLGYRSPAVYEAVLAA